MIQQSLVITKSHIDTWGKIITHCNDKIDFIRGYYSDRYADVVKKLEVEFKKVEKRIDEEDQIIIVFELDSLAVFKEMIYMFMRDRLKDLTTNDINSIVSILDRCDNWIEEYMNINGDSYVATSRFNNELKKWEKL